MHRVKDENIPATATKRSTQHRIFWSDSAINVWRNYVNRAQEVKSIPEGYNIVEMYKTSRNPKEPNFPGVHIKGEQYWPVKLRHKSNGDVKWIYLHSQEPTVRQIVQESFAQEAIRELYTCKEEEEEEGEYVWKQMQEEAINRHKEKLVSLLENHLQNGDSREVSLAKAKNEMLPTYRKELREVFFEKLKWMHQLRKDPDYQKVMETKKNLMDTEGYHWTEALESAIHQRKFLLNKQFHQVPVPHQESAPAPSIANYNRFYR